MDNSELVGEQDGISVSKKKGGFQVAYAFDRQLTKMLRDVPGAEFVTNENGKTVFEVPATSANALDKAIPAMRQEYKAIKTDLETIKHLALMSGMAAQRTNGGVSVRAMVSDYREVGKFYAGEVVNANARYVAQLTGFGKEDGAAFISIHRLADLDRPKLMKGDHIGVKYNDKFQGTVSDLSKTKSAADLTAEFEKNAGQTIDGVTASLSEKGDKIMVAFDMTPALHARIKRVNGAEFDRDAKAWAIAIADKEFALRAVHDMRTEFVLDGKEIETMRAVAATKIDSPKVSRAFTKDGQEHFGTVVAVGERYALQKGGQDRFTLHHLAALDQTPERDQNVSIKYNKGLGGVVDLDKQKEMNKALGVGR